MSTDSRSIILIFPVAAVPKGRPVPSRFGKPRTPERTRQFENHIQYLARTHYKDPPMDKPLSVQISFTMRRPKSVSKKKRAEHSVKPDLDNLIKSCFDALNGIVWVDDAQIVHLSAMKQYGDVDEIRVMVNEFIRV